MYCNYSKDKFGNEVTFIIPSWLDWEEQIIHKGDFEKSGSGSVDSSIFINSLLDSENSYLYLIKEGWKPQEARAVLPNALKTELVMTGFVSDWKHFFDLRMRGLTGKPHPSMQKVAEEAHKLIKNNLNIDL
jgi:thymidylate synthase (FAD)